MLQFKLLNWLSEVDIVLQLGFDPQTPVTVKYENFKINR